MSIQILQNLELNKNQLLNAVLQVVGSAPGTPAEGQVYYNSTSKVIEFYIGTGWVTLGRLDQVTAPTASVSMNSQKITNLQTPTSASDAATKGYVDSLASGATEWRQAARVATTTTLTLSSAPSSIDGVTLTSGDRVLVKNQSSGSENGIYLFNGTGSAMTRAADADSSAEVTAGLALWVTEGSTLADTAWVLTTNNPITLGSTSLTFVQFSGLGQIIDGDGLTKSGNTLAVNVDNSTIEINTDALRVKDGGITGAKLATGSVSLSSSTVTGTLPVTNGGTGATTASAARTSLGTPGKYAVDISGDDVATSFTVTHNLGTRDVVVLLRETTGSYAQFFTDVQILTTNSIDVVFSRAPATGTTYRVIVQG